MAAVAAAAPCRPLAQRPRWRGRCIAAAHNSGATPSSPSPPLGQRRGRRLAVDHGSLRRGPPRKTQQRHGNGTDKVQIRGRLLSSKRDPTRSSQHYTEHRRTRCSSRESPDGAGSPQCCSLSETNHRLARTRSNTFQAGEKIPIVVKKISSSNEDHAAHTRRRQQYSLRIQQVGGNPGFFFFFGQPNVFVGERGTTTSTTSTRTT